MITSLSNNFGAGTISLKDYQCSKYIVLQGTFTVDTSNADYAAATTLEITLPDLSIHTSTVSAVSVVITSDSVPYGTFCRAWIKNKNTLCLEKLISSENLGTMKFYIANIFTTVNSKLPIVVDGNVEAHLTESTISSSFISAPYNFAVVTEHWAYLTLNFERCYHGSNALPFSFKIAELPDDISLDIPVFCCKINGRKFGNGAFEFNVSNKVFTCLAQADSLNKYDDSRFLQFVAIRG